MSAEGPYVSRMTAGTPLSESNQEFSIVLSDAEDWDGDDVVRGESHYLPTTEQDTNESKPNTNLFLRTGVLSTSRRRSALGTTARKFDSGPKLKSAVQDSTATHQDIQKLCSWEIDLAPAVEVKEFASGEKRIAQYSFVGRSFKLPKDVPSKRKPEKSKSEMTWANECNASSSHGISQNSNVRVNTREDGAMVITSSHSKKDQEESKRAKGNNGWGNNFVRLNLKVCCLLKVKRLI